MGWMRLLQKAQSSMLALTALLVLLAVPTLAAVVLNHDLPLIQQQDFETTALGELPTLWEWVINEKSPTKPMVATTPSELAGTSGKQLLLLTRTASTANVTSHAVFNFAPVKERVVLSFMFYSTNASRALRVLMGGTKNEFAKIHLLKVRPAVYLSFGATIMPLKDSSKNTWYEQTPFTFGSWHRVVLDINIVENKYDLYLNDLQQPATSGPIPFYEPYSDLSTLGITYQSTSNTNNSSPVYVDDVIIWGK